MALDLVHIGIGDGLMLPAARPAVSAFQRLEPDAIIEQRGVEHLVFGVGLGDFYINVGIFVPVFVDVSKFFFLFLVSLNPLELTLFTACQFSFLYFRGIWIECRNLAGISPHGAVEPVLQAFVAFERILIGIHGCLVLDCRKDNHSVARPGT